MTRKPRSVAREGGSNLLLFGAIFIGVLALWDTMLVYPLKVLVVLMHELSHGLAAVLTGGSIVDIEVNENQGGVCWTRGGSRFIVLSAGYLGSMLMGAGLLVASARTKHGDRALATALGAVILGVTLVYVRNGFGLGFGIATGVALIVIGTKLPNQVADVVLKVIGTTSCLYAILDIKSDVLDRRGIGSDADRLADITFLPSVAWGVIWIGLALVCTFLAFVIAAGGPKQASAAGKRR